MAKTITTRYDVAEHLRTPEELAAYLSRCRNATKLPLALGFGIKEKADVDFVRGKADIAVIGTQSIGIMERDGAVAVGNFIRSLR